MFPAKRRPQVLPHEALEQAKDVLLRAQAAQIDGHLDGMVRQFECLYDLLVPPLDAFVGEQTDEAGSVCAGLCVLWEDLLGIDVERDNPEDLLIEAATWIEYDHHPPVAGARPTTQAERDAQIAWLGQTLQKLGVRQSGLWRRLMPPQREGLHDCAHIQVIRGGNLCFERAPLWQATDPHVLSAATDLRVAERRFSTHLAPLRGGDRLTLRWEMPLEGRAALLHTTECAEDSAVSVLLPLSATEAAVRRQGELVELCGELEALAPNTLQSVVLIWGPEQLPPSFGDEVVARQRIPPVCRAWRYCFHVLP